MSCLTLFNILGIGDFFIFSELVNILIRKQIVSALLIWLCCKVRYRFIDNLNYGGKFYRTVSPTHNNFTPFDSSYHCDSLLKLV